MPTVPIEGSYWVLDDRLLAGPHPGAHSQLAGLEIDLFIDLTENGQPYECRLDTNRQNYRRFPITDYDVPESKEYVKEILSTINAALSQGKTVYVHCAGGKGRTGTIVGCWLACNPNLGGPGDVLERLKRLREQNPDLVGTYSPETTRQKDFVRAWEVCCNTAVNRP